ncbi:Aldehyde reductase 1 [Verticillium dahliae VDG1]|nr:Aldehyde reductase 1 [Verticillium dahliae VDG1]
MAGLLCYTWIPKTAAGRAAMFNLSNKLSSSLETSGWRWRLRRTAFVASLLLPMAAMNLPSGMFVYWVSSATFGHINAALVERYMPLDKHQAPARRKDVPWKA